MTTTTLPTQADLDRAVYDLGVALCDEIDDLPRGRRIEVVRDPVDPWNATDEVVDPLIISRSVRIVAPTRRIHEALRRVREIEAVLGC